MLNSQRSFVFVSPQEFLSDREHGQARLSTVAASGELLMAVVSKDRVEGIKAKVANARDDWKSLMNNLQMREDALKVGLHLLVFGWCFLRQGLPWKRKFGFQRDYMINKCECLNECRLICIQYVDVCVHVLKYASLLTLFMHTSYCLRTDWV